VPSLPGQHDVAILRVLLSGGDILRTCIEMVATSDPRGPVSFHPIEIEENAPSIGEGAGVESVVHHGRSFGWLTGPNSGSSDGALRQRADWLAHWLALREQHRQLYSAAFTDSLTGAWNRRYFERFLESAIKDAQRRRQNLTILIFDIDDFKHYNDTYGHPAGDEILTETVRLLRSVVRPSDKVCRIGGDEFAVIFHEPEGPREAGSRHPGNIWAIATRFQKQVAAARFPKLGENAKGRLTISGGLATYPWDGHSVDSLVGRADELVLDSKRQGKNAICFGPDATPTGQDDTGEV
jgi:diguanylate cyclase (GGDEF)-like protein